MNRATEEEIFALILRRARAICLSTGKVISLITGRGIGGQIFAIFYDDKGSRKVSRVLDRLVLDKVLPASVLPHVKRRFHLESQKHRRFRRWRDE